MDNTNEITNPVRAIRAHCMECSNVLLEGGYSTPEEAKAQWEHEREGRGEDGPGRTGGTTLEGN